LTTRESYLIRICGNRLELERRPMIAKEERLELLKKYFGWDDEFISNLTPRDLQLASKIMKLEQKEEK